MRSNNFICTQILRAATRQLVLLWREAPRTTVPSFAPTTICITVWNGIPPRILLMTLVTRGPAEINISLPTRGWILDSRGSHGKSFPSAFLARTFWEITTWSLKISLEVCNPAKSNVVPTQESFGISSPRRIDLNVLSETEGYCFTGRQLTGPSRPASRLILLLVVLISGFASPARLVWGQSSGTTGYEVKAAFLFNFAKFIDWPPGSFASPQSAFTICVLGRDPFGNILDDSLQG